MKTITIYGSACSKCRQLTEATQQIINEYGIPAKIVKEVDISKIAAAGITGTPSLAIDGEIIFSGFLPSQEKLKSLLLEAIQFEGKSQNHSNPRACTSCDCAASPRTSNNFLKKIIISFVIILTLLSVVRLLNHSSTPQIEEQSAESPGTQTNYPLEAIYFIFGARCPSCVRMERWIQETIKTEFANEISKKVIIFRTQNATPEDAQKYHLTTKSLILKMHDRNGNNHWINAQKIWELNGNEQAFKSYISEIIQSALVQTRETR